MKNTDGDTVENLQKLIKSEPNAQPAKSGSTPLLSLANKLSKVPPSDTEKREYEYAVSILIEDMLQFHDDEFDCLIFFIESSDFNYSERIIESLIRNLDLNLSTDKPYRRALVIRLLVYLGYRFTPIQLDKERKVKENYPWIWIESMFYSDHKKAFEEVSNQLRNGTEFKNLIPSLNIWWEDLGEKMNTDLLRWISILFSQENEKGFDKLTNWAQKREILSESWTYDNYLLAEKYEEFQNVDMITISN